MMLCNWTTTATVLTKRKLTGPENSPFGHKKSYKYQVTPVSQPHSSPFSLFSLFSFTTFFNETGCGEGAFFSYFYSSEIDPWWLCTVLFAGIFILAWQISWLPKPWICQYAFYPPAEPNGLIYCYSLN